MAESTIPLDLLNPGQVFACIGIMEAADVLLGDAAAAFDWNNGGEPTFCVAADGSEPPVERVIRFLDESRVVTRAPDSSANPDSWKASWGEAPEIDDPGSPFPFPDPNSPATLPVVLRDHCGNEVALDYWGDATRRDNVKFWAGSAGYPGAGKVRDAIAIARDEIHHYVHNPFALSATQSNSFRFDWRRDYVPTQDGFSPNKHSKKIQMVGFPLVEILAAIGVSHARPQRRTKLEYRYGVLGRRDGSLLDPVFHRAALGVTLPIPAQPFRRFVMYLDWPGKEDQDRCITNVTEEETHQ